MFAKFEYIIGRLNRGNVRKGKKSKKVIQANAAQKQKNHFFTNALRSFQH